MQHGANKHTQYGERETDRDMETNKHTINPPAKSHQNGERERERGGVERENGVCEREEGGGCVCARLSV